MCARSRSQPLTHQERAAGVGAASWWGAAARSACNCPPPPRPGPQSCLSPRQTPPTPAHVTAGPRYTSRLSPGTRHNSAPAHVTAQPRYTSQLGPGTRHSSAPVHVTARPRHTAQLGPGTRHEGLHGNEPTIVSGRQSRNGDYDLLLG